MMDDNRCIIVKSDTGTGKSTFLPILLFAWVVKAKLAHYRNTVLKCNGGEWTEEDMMTICRIIVMVPTRLAAQKVCEHVQLILAAIKKVATSPDEFPGKNTEYTM